MIFSPSLLTYIHLDLNNIVSVTLIIDYYAEIDLVFASRSISGFATNLLNNVCP